MNMRNQARQIVTVYGEEIQKIRSTCSVSGGVKSCSRRSHKFASSKSSRAIREIYVVATRVTVNNEQTH